MSCNLNYFFVHLDAHMFPIPGTMFSARQANPSGSPMHASGCVTHIAQLTGQVMTPPAGQIQCFPKTGFRYWYQVKSIPNGTGGATTTIVPNSMIAVKGTPKEAGTNSGGINGPGRSCQYIEYKVFKTADGL